MTPMWFDSLDGVRQVMGACTPARAARERPSARRRRDARNPRGRAGSCRRSWRGLASSACLRSAADRPADPASPAAPSGRPHRWRVREREGPAPRQL